MWVSSKALTQGGCWLFQVLQPSAKEKYPAFTIVQGRSTDYDLSAALTPEKREWPFIRAPQRTVTTAGDFVLLWPCRWKTTERTLSKESKLPRISQPVVTLDNEKLLLNYSNSVCNELSATVIDWLENESFFWDFVFLFFILVLCKMQWPQIFFFYAHEDVHVRTVSHRFICFTKGGRSWKISKCLC